MTMTITIDQFDDAIALDLPQDAQEWARLFAAKQSDIDTGKQVYLNTLAVYALHHYLAQQGIESDLDQSQSWYPHALSAPNAADLIVSGVGRIECRPVLMDAASAFEIPDTAWEDRVAYVAVGIAERLDQVHLLGYLPVRSPDYLEQPIPFPQLLPIPDLPEHLQFLQEGLNWLESDDEVAVQVRELQDTYSLTHLVAQLETAYNETEEVFQDRRIADCLSGAASEMGATPREAVLKSPAIFGLKAEDDVTEEDMEDVLDTLAEDVLDKLRGIWGDRRRRVT
jgi:hypothetical protein